MIVSRPLLVAALAALVSLSTMSTSCTPPKTASGPTRPHAEWVGEEAVLLDDGIDVGAMPLGDAPPSRDEASEAVIPQRMEISDAVAVAKVIAVSTEPGVGGKRRYRLELSIVEPLFRTAPEGNIVLKVDPTAPAFGTVRAGDTKLIGRKLVVFFRQYAAEDGGDAITHFHLSPTTKTVLESVSKHATQSQFK